MESSLPSFPSIFTVYLAAEGFEKDLVEELGEAVHIVCDRLVVAEGPPRHAAWAQNIWLNPRVIPIQSIKQGAQALKSLQRNWVLWSVRHHRRAALIQDVLPSVAGKALVFPAPPPSAPLGSWTLWQPDMIIASPSCSSAFRHGEVTFVENKKDPPNRAYLKLWEALILAGDRPHPGQVCLDLGSSPGGWTWVLHTLGAHVISVDKAPLAPSIAALPGVFFRQESAFGLSPADVPPIDWLCSDIICYPERLLSLVHTWINSGKVKNFVCTVKFQGETDHNTAAAFAAIPGSRLAHLYHNKHELTWVKTGR